MTLQRDGIDDDSDDKDSKRKSRNLSEKKRRDQFNLLVNELSTMVSTIGGRKMDKTTVLKATISFLKNHNEIAIKSRVHEIPDNWKPNFLTNEEFTHLILEAVDGFLIVLGKSGNILYISESITSLLGYIPEDIIGMTIYDLGYSEEQNNVYNILTGATTEEQCSTSFSCHLRSAIYDQRQNPSYDLIHFTGYFRTVSESDCSNYNVFSEESASRLVFIGSGRLQIPHLTNEMRLNNLTTKTEFTSKHSLEWKFLYLDQKAPPIIGYLPFELLGTSGYDYYHIDDMDRVIGCHDALMQKGEGVSCYYRFLTKGQQWIWLQTRFYITYHQWNSKPEFIVCIHRVVSHADATKGDFNTFQNESSSTSDNSTSAVSRYFRNYKTDNTINRHQYQQNQSKSHHSEQQQRHHEKSADSDISKNSILTHTSKNDDQSLILSNNHEPSQSGQSTIMSSLPQSSVSVTNVTSIEPTEDVAMIQTQFPSPAADILQTTTTDRIDENLERSNQIQVDLQRKHVELQTIIDQQQVELRRVNEQLLMARLGILQTSQTQAASISTIVRSYNTGTVSSTTNLLVPLSASGVTDQIAAANVTQSNIVYLSLVPDE